MSCENTTAQALKDSGHRLTPQRLMILSAVRHTNGHVTAAQIIEEVREGYPYIDASTVYRTLGVLKRMRLVSETNMGSGESVYEWIDMSFAELSNMINEDGVPGSDTKNNGSD